MSTKERELTHRYFYLGIRMALVALRSFMLTSADGAVGSIDGVPDETKRQIAEKSRSFKCPKCKDQNDALLPDDIAHREDSPDAKEFEEAFELAFAYKPSSGTSTPSGPATESAPAQQPKQQQQQQTQQVQQAPGSTRETPQSNNGQLFRSKVAVVLSILIVIWAMRGLSTQL